MKSAYQILRRPVITEKGLAIKENQNTLVFQVAPKATKTEIKEAVQGIFKVKVHSVRTANFPAKNAAEESSQATVPIGRRHTCDYAPEKKCRSTRRIYKTAISYQPSAFSKTTAR